MFRWCLGMLLVLGLVSAPAHAMPGDAPFAPLEPADGAALPVDTGIPVRFTCPVFRVSDAGDFFVVYGGAKEYGVSLSRTPDTGPDGRLAGPVGLSSARLEAPPDQCASALEPGLVSRPQEMPGTYYWQVWRLCVACSGSYEVGPVRRLVLRSAAKLSLRPSARAYGGYPFILPLGLTGVPDGTEVTVERRSGTRWRPAGSAVALGEKGDASVTLPAGATKLRAIVRLGDTTVTSREAPLTVRRALRWTTDARDDGRYVLRPGGQRSARVHVTRGGRELRGFEADVPMLCPTPGLSNPFTTQIGYAAIERIRIAPDGSFLAASTPERSTSIRVRGKLRSRRIVDGRVELSVGTCSGSAAYSARRVGAGTG